MKTPPSSAPLRSRVRRIRVDTFGPRGRSRFARELELSASTYTAYETHRTAPADVLVRISEVTGADLRWLLTGQFPMAGSIDDPPPKDRRDAKIIERFACMHRRHKRIVPALVALIDLLEDAGEVECATWNKQRAIPRRPRANLIPVVGRSAAGVPGHWLGDPAVADPFERISAPRSNAIPCSVEADDFTPALPDGSLVQSSQPVLFDGVSVSEFVSAPSLRKTHPHAFALRIDGDSMAPRIRHGDLVIASPDQPARPGRPAVVKLRNGIGVVCKLLVPRGERIRLVPINPAFPTSSHHRDDVFRALAVLGTVRRPESAR